MCDNVPKDNGKVRSLIESMSGSDLKLVFLNLI